MKFGVLKSKIERHWLTIAFVCGFITDYILLNRVDDVFDNLMLLFYVTLATISIVMLYAGIALRFGERWSPRVTRFAGITMQYSFGGLFSGMLIFYGHSGDIFASWPFLILIIGAIAGNELVKNRGQQLVFNILAYFVGLFSYLVLVIPVFTGYLGVWAFLGSGTLALVFVYLLIQLLARVIPNYLLLQMRKIVFLVVGMFVFLNTLYFTNVIPPIPLSLKEIVIAHSTVRFENPRSYQLRVEPISWWRLDERLWLTVHPDRSRSLSCFTRVYAPTKIRTEIFHHWEYRDQNGNWKTHFRFPYPITGEATDGYRGYTTITVFQDGEWRCGVETARGQVLGRQVFRVDSTKSPDSLITETR
jgi:Protein of unknown function (DUF2914)